MKTIIIAEAGVNHNGDVLLAKELIDVAKDSGADYVKFQIFKSELLSTAEAKKAEYQKKDDKNESQKEMLENLELDFDVFKDLKNYADEIGIGFLASAFDNESLEFLIDLKLDFIKIPSGEINNVPYLERISKEKVELILSTGMSTIDEISRALEILIKGKKITKDKIIILHCNTDYPTKIEDVNLRAIEEINKNFGCRVGYSDHTLGNNVSMGAVCMGAKVIEKHITTNKNLSGPDHKASMDPDEFTKFVKDIRDAEIFLGENRKVPSKSELRNIKHARRYIVALKNIKKGEQFSKENITSKRTSSGISIENWNDVIGKEAEQDFSKDSIIKIPNGGFYED